MKLALFDPYLNKFTDGMQKWWSQNGYEVQAQRYYNPQLAEWADVIWFETVDKEVIWEVIVEIFHDEIVENYINNCKKNQN
jgi:hypothetical protein